MKQTLFFLLLFVSALAFGQTPLYTAGITYTNGVPAHNPGNTGSKYAVDTVNWNWYVRSYGTTWQLIGNNWPQSISGCSAPAYTPTKFQSKVVINACDPPELYIWDGSAWDEIGAGGGGGVTGTGLANRVAIWESPTNLYYDVNFVYDTVNNELGVRTADPQRTLDVNGEVRIRDLTTDTPTRLVGADADGDLNEAGSGLANRLALWTGTGRVGFGAAFRIDTTNARIGISSASSPVTPLDFGITLGQKISLYASGNDRSGFSTASGALRYYVSNSSTSNAHVFGTLSTADGSTFTEGLRISTLDGSQTRILSNAQNLRIGRTSSSYTEIGQTLTDALGFNLASQRHITGDNVNFSYTSSGANEAWLAVGNGTIRGFAATITATGTTEVAAGTFSNHPYALRAGGNIVRMRIGANGDVSIGTNFTAAARLDVRGSGATSATSALEVNNSNDSIILAARNDRRVGVNTSTPDVSLDAGDNTDGIKLPSGTTAQRPSVNNVLRNNTDVEGLEYRENGVWYRLTSSQTPTVAAGAAAGTGPTVTVVGSDLAGRVTLTTGTGATTGALFTVTYGDAFDASANFYVTISARDADASTLQLFISAESSSSFTVSTNNAPANSTEYIINYHVGQ